MRSVWSVLLRKADAEIDTARRRLADVADQKALSLKNRDQLNAMSERYMQELQAAQREPHLTGQVEFHRRFIGQIQALQKRLAGDLALLEQELNQARSQYEALSRERYRIACLAEREAAMAAASQRKREVRRLDELGVTAFNLANRAAGK